MSKAATSPTARLLQSSRLFSLPRSLPQPVLETLSSTGTYRVSPTATLPHPTHQAVVTTSDSHFRGDWGLKRSLPARANRGPKIKNIRIAAQDTAEQITDFSSASDHTRTRLKWKELGIPVLRKSPQASLLTRSQPVSVFDNAVDHTDLAQDQALATDDRYGVDGVQLKKRWKFENPWLAGLQDGDFEIYLTRAIHARRHEWQKFLQKKESERRLPHTLQEAAVGSDGQIISTHRSPEATRKLETSKTLRDEHVRDDGALSSGLATLITEFLDLPGITIAPDTMSRVHRSLLDIGNADSSNPSTHPSLGLSYLRSGAYMDNHPLHGPQAHRTPVLARVVRPRNSGTPMSEAYAKLGVAGFVTNDPVSTSFRYNQMTSSVSGEHDPNALTSRLDIDATGGNKIWVHAQDAISDENGRIRLTVTRGDREAIAVRTGNVQAVHQTKRPALFGSPSSASPAIGQTGP